MQLFNFYIYYILNYYILYYKRRRVNINFDFFFFHPDLLLYNQINFELSNSSFSKLKYFNLLLSITYIKGVEQINPPIKPVNKKKFIILNLYLV